MEVRVLHLAGQRHRQTGTQRQKDETPGQGQRAVAFTRAERMRGGRREASQKPGVSPRMGARKVWP